MMSNATVPSRYEHYRHDVGVASTHRSTEVSSHSTARACYQEWAGAVKGFQSNRLNTQGTCRHDWRR